jgi:hypothetical protein
MLGDQAEVERKENEDTQRNKQLLNIISDLLQNGQERNGTLSNVE